MTSFLAAAALSLLAHAEPEAGRLLVFVQPGASAVQTEFERTTLPAIRELAQAAGAEFEVRDIAEGAPADVTLTPLLVFENWRGRSFYFGRTTTLERVGSFLRTARRAPQADTPLVREDGAVLRLGRAQLALALKITPLAGDASEPLGKANAALARGFTRAELADEITLARADRTFYLDFHPWRGADDAFCVAAALYSPFHCKDPVFATPAEAPLCGTWSERDAVLARAAALLERELLRVLSDPVGGDGVDAVPDVAPVVEWEPLAERPASAVGPAGGPELASRWIVANESTITFHFAPPLDVYAGEVLSPRGEITLPRDLALSGARGHVEVDVTAVTMGEADLDRALHDDMLQAGRFPGARFEIESVESEGLLAWGLLAPAVVQGSFTLKGVTVQVRVAAQVEPVIGEDGLARLSIEAGAELRLKQAFAIEGPDGPEPARDTLRLDVRLVGVESR